ncbi:STAS domain-containing protein [Desulfovibrionales bacterium]
MHIESLEQNGIVIVKPVGSMDATTTSIFVNACEEHLNTGKGKLAVDLSGIEYISSAGLRGVLTILKASRTLGATVAFCCLQPMVAEVFRISGFTSMMTLADSLDAALASL